MKRLKWESTEWGWVAKTGSTTLTLVEGVYSARLWNKDYQIAGTSLTATTVQGAKRAACQWARGVVRELAKEWE